MKTIPPTSFTVELRRRKLWVRGLGQAAVRDLMTIIAGRHLEPKKEPACERCKGTGEVRPDGYAWCCPDCGGTGKANDAGERQPAEPLKP